VIRRESTLTDVAFEVCTALDRVARLGQVRSLMIGEYGIEEIHLFLRAVDRPWKSDTRPTPSAAAAPARPR
jgi:hypothetical protein